MNTTIKQTIADMLRKELGQINKKRLQLKNGKFLTANHIKTANTLIEQKCDATFINLNNSNDSVFCVLKFYTKDTPELQLYISKNEQAFSIDIEMIGNVSFKAYLQNNYNVDVISSQYGTIVIMLLNNIIEKLT